MASCDKQVKMWDLQTNQAIQVAQHDAPVKIVRWVKAPNYTALMSGSWDKTLKFWDQRTPNPMMTIDLGERCYAADVDVSIGNVDLISWFNLTLQIRFLFILLTYS